MPVPPEIEALLRRRDDARAARDFALADSLRDEIAAAGWEVRDAPGGATAVPRAAYETVDPSPGVVSKPLQIARAPSRRIAINVAYDGHRDDLTRFLSSLEEHCAAHDYAVVVSEAGGDDGAWVESLRSARVQPVHLKHDPGWARRMNVCAHLPEAAARIVAFADTSVEATGDLLGPILRAFDDDPTVGVAGPWGLVTGNLRDFESSDGPEVDAVEGYFLATRHEIVERVSFDDKFRWYRHADIDFSFQVRALGYTAVVTEPAGTRHEHRAWAALQPEERERRSRKNFNRFLEHFRDRSDLLVASKLQP